MQFVSQAASGKSTSVGSAVPPCAAGLQSFAGTGDDGLIAQMKARSRQHSIRQQSIVFVALLLCCVLLAGCTKKRSRAHFAQAERLVAAGDCKSAQVELAKAIEIDQTFVDPHFLLATCALRYTDTKRAYDELKAVTELAPNNLVAQIQFGELELASGDFANTKKQADFVLQRDPNNLAGHLLQAKLLMRLEQWDAARLEIGRASAAAPTSAAPYVLLGALERKQSRYADSEIALKKALALAPQSTDALIALGKLHQAQTQFQEAESAFRRGAGDPLAYSALASMYIAQGQSAQAEQVARSAQTALPRDPRAYRLLGNFYISSHRWNQAVTEFSRIVQAHPEDRRARKNYAQLLLLTDRLEPASEATFEVERDDPNDPESLVLQAQIELLRGHPDMAKKIAEDALILQSNNAMAHFYVGLALLQRGDFGAGDRELKRAQDLIDQGQKLRSNSLEFNDLEAFNESSQRIAEMYPLSPTGYARAAEIEIARAHLDTAEHWLQESIKSAPDNPIGYARLAMLRVSQGNNAEGEQLFEKALLQDADDSEAVNGLVSLYLHENQPERALTRLKAQIANVPDSSDLYVALARFYLGQGDLRGANEAAQKALQLDGKNADAYLARSRILREQGELSQAIHLIDGWVREAPTPRGYVELGELYESDGKWQQAQEAFKTALKQDPSLNVAADNLARSLMEHDGNLDVAVTLSTSTRTNEPLNPRFADTLGWAYYKKGIYRSARALFEEAVAKMPGDAEAHYHLGLTYRKLAETSKAEDQLKIVLQLDPKFKHADTVKDNLASLNPKQFRKTQ
jgi:cellulose synthase operon protein C